MFCEFCGKEIDNKVDFCTHCGMPIGEDAENQTQTYTHTAMAAPANTKPSITQSTSANNYSSQVKGNTGMVLAEGEVIVKEYNCANVKGASGYLTVTNKRLIFNASGSSSSAGALGSPSNSRYSEEITLSSVSGLTCHKGTNYNARFIVPGVLFVLLGLFVCLSLSNSYFSSTAYMGFAPIAIGAFLLYLGIRPSFLIAVYAKDVSISPIVVGEGPTSLVGNSALIALTSTPTKDTDIMLNELGAMIQDLQSMGDIAIEKWQNRVSNVDLPKIHEAR